MTNAKRALYRAHKARNRAARDAKLAIKRGLGIDTREMMKKVIIAYKASFRKMGRNETLEALHYMSAGYRIVAARTYKQLKAGFSDKSINTNTIPDHV